MDYDKFITDRRFDNLDKRISDLEDRNKLLKNFILILIKRELKKSCHEITCKMLKEIYNKIINE